MNKWQRILFPKLHKKLQDLQAENMYLGAFHDKIVSLAHNEPQPSVTGWFDPQFVMGRMEAKTVFNLIKGNTE